MDKLKLETNINVMVTLLSKILGMLYLILLLQSLVVTTLISAYLFINFGNNVGTIVTIIIVLLLYRSFRPRGKNGK